VEPPATGGHRESQGEAQPPKDGGWVKAPSPRKQGDRLRSPQPLSDFCSFSIKITHFYAYFGQNSYFKAITHQLKGFKISLNVLNRINEVQVL